MPCSSKPAPNGGASWRSWARRGHAGERGDAAHDLEDRSPAPRPARPSGSPYRGKIDFGILTIREDESTAVLRRFARVATEARQRRYRIRSLELPGGGAYTLAVLRCPERGTTDAQAAAHALIEDLAPRFVLVVGIAGAVPSHELSLGDVVVSSRIVDFSVEAVIRDQAREYALSGGPLHADAARLAADVSAMVADGELDGWSSPEAVARPRPPIDLAADRFYGDADWQRSVREQLGRHFADRAPRPPLAMIGAIASSDRLIKDDETLSVWMKIARQVVAVEMESAGIYKATHGRNVPSSRSAASATWSASGAIPTGPRTPARPPPRSRRRSCAPGRSSRSRGRDAPAMGARAAGSPI